MNPYILSTIAPYFSYLKSIFIKEKECVERTRQIRQIYHNAVAAGLISYLIFRHPKLKNRFQRYEPDSQGNQSSMISLIDADKHSCLTKHSEKMRLRGDIHRYCQQNRIPHTITFNMAVLIYSHFYSLNAGSHNRVFCPECYHIAHFVGCEQKCVYCQHEIVDFCPINPPRGCFDCWI